MESGRAKLVGITRNITAGKNAELKISTLARTEPKTCWQT
jgi:hypothetical protein